MAPHSSPKRENWASAAFWKSGEANEGDDGKGEDGVGEGDDGTDCFGAANEKSDGSVTAER